MQINGHDCMEGNKRGKSKLMYYIFQQMNQTLNFLKVLIGCNQREGVQRATFKKYNNKR